MLNPSAGGAGVPAEGKLSPPHNVRRTQRGGCCSASLRQHHLPLYPSYPEGKGLVASQYAELPHSALSIQGYLISCQLSTDKLAM